MAGILDAKTRIFDTIITEEGRRQISSGKLRAEFYSFTDAGAVYSLQDLFASGTNTLDSDIATKFCFEATNLPQDQVTFEADDSGKLHIRELQPIGNTSVRVIAGQMFSGSIQTVLEPVTASNEFASLAVGLLSASIDNFKKLYIIGSPDLFNEHGDRFEVAPTKVEFTITDDRPIQSQQNGGTQQASIDQIESLFADKRLSHVPNFQFLPPVNKPRLGTNLARPLGIYTEIGQRPIFDFIDLQAELQTSEANGFIRDIQFAETSKANRIVAQMFELADSTLTKLDVIDFGSFTIQGQEVTEAERKKAEDQGRQIHTKHVFFVGKVFVDSFGSNTFVNLFTIIWE